MSGSFLLVGGTGGLGRATAELLAEQDARLSVSYCTNAERAASLKTIANVVQADITRERDRARLLDEVGQIDGLAIFTGHPSRVSSTEQAQEKMEFSHAVNYMGPLLLARETAERMKQRQSAGCIVLFSTMQGVGLFSGSTVYAGAKAALIHGARILAKELRRDNIRVNVIAPGVMAAGMAEASIASGKYDRYLSEGIIPRFGRAVDVAKTVRFLFEPDNYITGQVISVDGGITL